MTIGVQMYTVREYCKDLEGFSNTLSRIADMGYTTVQVSGTCAYPADWLAAELTRTGLKCVITHIKPEIIRDETAKVSADHLIFGCRNIGIGALPGCVIDEEKYTSFVKEYLPVAKALKAEGQKLFYHNHWFEFERSIDGRIYFDRFLEDFPADLLGITFDTYWAQFSGADPAEFLKKLKGRIECIHLKDMTMFGHKEQRMAPVGYGNMNFERIISSAEDAQAQFLLVEQDKCYDEDPFDCLKKSYDYLRSLGLN